MLFVLFVRSRFSVEWRLLEGGSTLKMLLFDELFFTLFIVVEREGPGGVFSLKSQ